MEKGDALLVIEVQRDFCSGGALAVPGADDIVPVLNGLIEVAERAGVPIFASRDWHPRGHPSFKEKGGPWPPHCIQDTRGAEFHPGLRLPSTTRVITKGTRFDRDQSSAFDETGLATELQREEVRRVWVGGLAEDICVRATVLDGLRAGFEMHLVADATKPIDREAGERAVKEMRRAGAVIEERA